MPVIDNVVKVFTPATISFFLGIALTFPLSKYLYSHQMWKKKAGKVALDGTSTPIFNKLHEHKEVGTPKLGGVIIWLSSLITILVIWLGAKIVPTVATQKLDFLSRDQTWVPLAALIIGAIVGLIDDILDIKGTGGHISGGLPLKKRIALVSF